MSDTAQGSHRRLHALDGLRATMMLLGIVLHTAISYTVIDYGDAWGYKDQSTTFAADIMVIFIHIFRMPIFFVMAGFFTALLYFRRGAMGMAKNRFVRIVIPFITGWAILYPLVVGGFVFALVTQSRATGIELPPAPEGSSIWDLFFGNSTLHLWFLYYLIWFYLLALLLAPAIYRLPSGLRTGVTEVFAAIVKRPLLRLVVLTLVTFPVLMSMEGTITTPGTFIPELPVMLAYGLFFGFGWLLYSMRDQLAIFERLAWSHVIVAVLLFLSLEGALEAMTDAGLAESARMVFQSCMVAAMTWLLFFGFTGLFLRYFDQPSPRVRYIVDASYWVYLVHLPFTIWIPGLMAGNTWSPWLKMSIVMSATALLSFATYDLFVRSTAIGAVLNGRRYARGLPRTEAVTETPVK